MTPHAYFWCSAHNTVGVGVLGERAPGPSDGALWKERHGSAAGAGASCMCTGAGVPVWRVRSFDAAEEVRVAVCCYAAGQELRRVGPPPTGYKPTSQKGDFTWKSALLCRGKVFLYLLPDPRS